MKPKLPREPALSPDGPVPSKVKPTPSFEWNANFATLNVKLASALLNYPVTLLTSVAFIEIGVVLLWACIPLLTQPAPNDKYMDYWFFLGYYSFVYMLCAANICYAALYIYTRKFCCNSRKDYYVCVASFTIANFVVGGVPGIAHELLKGKEGPHRTAALVWLQDLGGSKIYWPLLAVVGSLLYAIWCAIQCRKVVQKTSSSLNPPVPELRTDYVAKQESQITSGSIQNAMKNADQPLTFKGYFSWIMVIVLILSTYYQGQIFSYLYFATAPHTFIVDVVSISAFKAWISIGMKNIGAFIVSKYTGRPDIFHFVYTFTQFTSNVFYRNLILAKSLEGSSVIAVVNISGVLSLAKILISCSKRYLHFVYPELRDSVDNSGSVIAEGNKSKNLEDELYRIHIRSIALDYGETIRVQIVTMIAFFCWTFMIRSGPNAIFYHVFSEASIDNEKLHLAMLLSVGILGFECLTNVVIWLLVRKIYKINLWSEYIQNLVDNPLIVWVSSLTGIHVLGDMLIAVVALSFFP